MVTVWSDPDKSSAEAMIGKCLVAIENNEYTLSLVFDDETRIFARGSNYDGCALEVEFGVTE